MKDKEREQLRYSFIPSKIKILYIGESPPAGGTFFYKADSILFTAIQESFKSVFPNCGNGQSFLNFFKNNHLFLDDLCHYPINKFKDSIREQARQSEVRSLSKRLTEMKPRIIISVMKRINPHLQKAISISGIEIESFDELPFPRIEYKARFIEENKNLLEKYLKV